MKQLTADVDYTIRSFTSITDHEQCQALQGQVWGETSAVPVNMTVALQRHGGVAIGAFEARTQRMVGFVFSFLAPMHPAQTLEARDSSMGLSLSHHSHMAAVAPEWRNRGIGTALKLAQRKAVLALGLNLITWTYDPLEAKNATLNIRKLGCICRIYQRNVYGEMRDDMNAGLPSDRFEVEWWLDSSKPVVNPKSPRAEIEIPLDFQAMKRTDLNLAKAWRMRTRLQFEQAFQNGYAVAGFSTGTTRAVYTLVEVTPKQQLVPVQNTRLPATGVLKS